MSVTARSSGQRLGGDDDHTNDDCNFRRRADAVAATTAAGMAAARRHGHGDEDASSLKDAAAAAAEAEPEAAAECGEACPCGACAAPPSFVVGVAHAAIPPPGAEDDVTFERMDMDPSMAPGAPCERLTVDFEPAVTARAETAAAVAEAERAAIAAHAEEASAARDAAAVEAAEAAEARSAMAATATAALAVVTAVAEDDPEVAAIQAAAAATQHRAEQAIQQLVAIAAMADVASSLRTVLRILDNVRDNPHESRFRRLRWANAALRARVQRFPPAVALLRAAGFTVRAQVLAGLGVCWVLFSAHTLERRAGGETPPLTRRCVGGAATGGCGERARAATDARRPRTAVSGVARCPDLPGVRAGDACLRATAADVTSSHAPVGLFFPRCIYGGPQSSGPYLRQEASRRPAPAVASTPPVPPRSYSPAPAAPPARAPRCGGRSCRSVESACSEGTFGCGRRQFAA